jgi:hypothetical protein
MVLDGHYSPLGNHLRYYPLQLEKGKGEKDVARHRKSADSDWIISQGVIF